MIKNQRQIFMYTVMTKEEIYTNNNGMDITLNHL